MTTDIEKTRRGRSAEKEGEFAASVFDPTTRQAERASLVELRREVDRAHLILETLEAQLKGRQERRRGRADILRTEEVAQLYSEYWLG